MREVIYTGAMVYALALQDGGRVLRIDTFADEAHQQVVERISVPMDAITAITLARQLGTGILAEANGGVERP